MCESEVARAGQPLSDPRLVSSVRDASERVLNDAWDVEHGCCRPHASAYPHQWLWDSCFHAIGWAALGDQRAVVELERIFSTQLDSGFVPHMRYLSPTVRRGPLNDRSSYTQPPIYAHALRCCVDAGLEVPRELVERVWLALDQLWRERRTPDGLVYIVHPWEAGTDDSPRWDSWVGIDEWDLQAMFEHDLVTVGDTFFDQFGAAAWSRSFVSCPASFNALTAWAMREFAAVSGEQLWVDRSVELASTIDALLWNDDERLWDDLAVVGGGVSVSTPTLDGLLPALVSADVERVNAALGQLADPTRFAAPFGCAYLPRTHRLFLPDIYWRGPAWPQLDYLLWHAASNAGLADLALSLAAAAASGAEVSGFAEYRNPLDGTGHGARPQTWAAVAAAYTPKDAAGTR